MLKSVELRNFKSFHNKVKIDFEKTNWKRKKELSYAAKSRKN